MAQTGSKHIDELVRRAIIGDGTAFTALWDANIASVRAYLRKTMTQLDHFYIEDVGSKTFEKAFRQIHSFDPSLGSFEAWLGRIAHNTALDVIDQEKRRQRGYISFDDDPRTLNVVDSMGGVEEDALDEIIKTEAREETESMVDGLPEIYREIARKRLIEGMQYKEALSYLKHHGVSSKAGNLKINGYAMIRNAFSLKSAIVFWFIASSIL